LAAAAAIAAIAPASAAADSITVGSQGDAVAIFQTPTGRPDSSTPYRVAIRPAGARFGAAAALAGRGSDQPTVAVDEHGGALAAWSQRVAGRFRILASVRSAGGDFGTPVTLAKSADRSPVVATDPEGNGLVVWETTTGSMRSIAHPAGGGFEPARDLPDSGIPRALRTDASGEWLLLSVLANPSGEDGIVQVSRGSPGGDFDAARPIGRTSMYEPTLLATNARGEAVAVFSSAAGLERSYRSAGGAFGAPDTIVPGRQGCARIRVQDVDIAADGSVVAAWAAERQAGSGCFESSDLFAAAAPAGDAAFGTPLRLTRLLRPAGSSEVAVNERGDAAVAWGADGFFVDGLVRSAGGPFGQPLLLSRPALGGLPAVAVDADGVATALWRQNDGERVNEMTRRFSAGGLEPAEPIASAPAYHRDPGGPRMCHPPGSTTLLQNGQVRVYRQHGGYHAKFACLLASGRRETLDFGFGDFTSIAKPPPAIALAGPLVAYTYFDEECGTCGGREGVTVTDLRLRLPANGFGPAGDPDPTTYDYGRIERIVLRRDAAVAWTQCAGSHADCRSGRARVRVFKLDSGAAYQKLVAKGRGIPSRSLRLRGEKIAWRQSGRVRSVPLLRQSNLP
jgi:hypothetical protein